VDRDVPVGPVAAVAGEAEDRAERAERGVAAGIEAAMAGRAVSGAATEDAGPVLAPLPEPGPATGVPPPAAHAASSSVTTARTVAGSARAAEWARPAEPAPAGRLARLVHFVNGIRVLPLLWCSRLGDLWRGRG
jgi:hypothetical protein